MFELVSTLFVLENAAFVGKTFFLVKKF